MPKLSDGVVADSASECVQYDDDVLITADLGKKQFIQDVKVGTFFRAGDLNRKR